MKKLRLGLGYAGLTALLLSYTTSARIAWAVVAMIAGLAAFGVILWERCASR